jgi:phosphohistidine phosphatase SixA
MPLILLRHAWAGSRDDWHTDDRDRPLDDRGREQARNVVSVLADFPIDEIHTSPYVRCVQTVEPLAAARGLELQLREELGEDHWHEGPAVLTELAGRDVVVCGHGGLDAVVPDAPKWKKGAAFVLDAELRLLDVLRA